MTAPFHPRWDTLPAAQRALWQELAPAQSLGYVLYGGTAIALRLGHRVSVDFDFFTDQPLVESNLRKTLAFLAEATTLQAAPDTLTVTTRPLSAAAGSVKISFFGNIRFGRVGIPDHTPDQVAQVASFDDLMATKLKVILQRVEARDYRDIVAMIHSGVDLATGLASARRLFGNAFQPSESLKALTWFHGGDLDTLTVDEKTLLATAASAVRSLPDVELASTTLGTSRRDSE